MTFAVYSLLFAFSLVMTLHSLWKRADVVSAYFILAVYALISIFIQLHWNQIGNPFNNRFIS